MAENEELNPTQMVQETVDLQVKGWHFARGAWIILPGTMVGFSSIDWVLVTLDEEGLRRGREVLDAFLGHPNYQLTLLDSDMAIKIGQDEITNPTCHSLTLSVDEKFERSLLMLARTVSKTPKLELSERSVSDLLRDFRLSIAQLDRESASESLDLLERNSELSSQNLRFLRIDYLGSFNLWTDLFNLPWLMTITTLPLPRPTAELILQAIWNVFFVNAGAVEPGSAVVAYADLPQDFHLLFDSIDVPTSTDAQRLVALRAIEQKSVDRSARIRSKINRSYLGWIEEVGQIAGASVQIGSPDTETGIVVRDPGQIALEHLEYGRLSDLVDLAAQFPSEFVVVDLAVRIVLDFHDRDAAKRLMELVPGIESMSSELRFQVRIVELAELAEDSCGSWSQWLIRVASDEIWPTASDVIRNAHLDWSIDEFKSVTRSQQCAQLLDNAQHGVNASAVERSLDLLCELGSEIGVYAASDQFIDALLMLLLEGIPSSSVAKSFVDLVRDLLDTGATSDRYSDLLTVCIQAEELYTSRHLLESLIDLLDTLALFPCADEDLRIQLAIKAGTSIERLVVIGTIDRNEVHLALPLLDELGCPAEVVQQTRFVSEIPEVEDNWRKADGKKITIYTLFSGLGERFRDRVIQRCPTANVIVRSDHVASQQFADVIQASDFVLVDTKHAKHSATAQIDDLLQREVQILPVGKGVTSFLRALEARLETCV